MPTISAHVSEEDAQAVEAAAKSSNEKKVGPYVAEAVRQRMAREGMLPGNPQAELLAVAEDPAIGGVENAVLVLKRAARKRKVAA